MKLPLLYREMVTVSFEWPDVMRRFDRIARYVRLPSSPFSAVAGVQRYKSRGFIQELASDPQQQPTKGVESVQNAALIQDCF